MKTPLFKSFALSAIIFCALFGFSLPTRASYDFSATSPSGQVLFYNITDNSNRTVSITYPGTGNQSSAYFGYTQPTGVLTIPSIVTYNDTVYSVTSIGNDAFYGCRGLTSVTIPYYVSTIGNRAFSYCSGLTNVTIYSVTSIGVSAFYECSGLISMTIPNSVTTIGNNAFYQVKNIIYHGTATGGPWGSLTWNGYVDGIFVFTDRTETTLTGCKSTVNVVTIPSTVIAIGNYAFYGCINLISVTIPNSIVNIGSSAFSGCRGLTNVTIPNSVTTIGNSAFSNCSGLTSVTIPNSVNSIGNEAFSGCRGLTSVTIGNSVASIGTHAFANCIAILSVTSNAVVAPILDGDEVFSGFNPMTPLYIPQGSRDTYVARNWDLYFDIREQNSIVRTSAANYTVGTDDMRIVVRGAEGQHIRIYDNLGRLLSNTQSAEGVRVFVMPATGIYMVQVGNDPAHKVALVH